MGDIVFKETLSVLKFCSWTSVPICIVVERKGSVVIAEVKNERGLLGRLKLRVDQYTWERERDMLAAILENQRTSWILVEPADA